MVWRKFTFLFHLLETYNLKITLFQTYYNAGLSYLIVWLLVSLVRLLNLPFDRLHSSLVVMQELSDAMHCLQRVFLILKEISFLSRTFIFGVKKEDFIY